MHKGGDEQLLESPRMPHNALDLIKEAKVLILDFDGVLKESLDAKGEAFCALFENLDETTLNAIRSHHLENGGVPRSRKIPIYFTLAGLELDERLLRIKLKQLSSLIVSKVIECAWVQGSIELITKNPYRQTLYIASAAPKEELEEIFNQAKILSCFASIYGSEITKKDACREIIEREGCEPRNCVFIGDSLTDYLSATEAGIPIILRSHRHNQHLIKKYQVPTFEDFRSIIPLNSLKP